MITLKTLSAKLYRMILKSCKAMENKISWSRVSYE